MPPVDHIHAALKEVNPAWTPMRSAEVEARLTARLDRSKRVRLLAGVMATSATVAAATAGILIWQAHTSGIVPGGEVSRAREVGGGLRFLDGTTAIATDPDSDLRVTEDTPTRQTVKVVKGGAHFHVAKGKGRVFRVELRDVVVEVLGTTFVVEEANDRVRVSVDEGRVRVRQGGLTLDLGTGDVHLFPTDAGAPPSGNGVPSASDDLPGAPGEAPPPVDLGGKPGRATEHRSDAAAHRAGGLFRAETRRDRVGDWMLAADNARLSGDPAAALPYLRAVTEKFPRDGRAPVAAFTMGLLLLEQLGRPAEAARAFSDVVRLDTAAAPLTEDALAREVEAWRQAGKPDRARQSAVEYLRRYPDGRRSHSVRQFGGLR
jgi:transmembrane sensor